MEDVHKENILNIGIATLRELEEMVKAFRLMNQYAQRKRFVISREDIRDPDGNILVEKARDFTIPALKLLQRIYKGDHFMKIFSPEEGIAVISDARTEYGKAFSESLNRQVINIGGGVYEAFIDSLNSLHDLFALFRKGHSPKLVVIGYLSVKSLQAELDMFSELKRFDPYLRFLDILHADVKPKSFIRDVPNFMIDEKDEKTWHKFVIRLIREYTKPYFVEEIGKG